MRDDDELRSGQFVAGPPAEPGTRLARPEHPLDYFRIDWAAIGRRRAADIAKLDSMQRYAYLSKCRREFVLRYFGDAAAKPKCKGCDNCLGVQLSKRAKARVTKRRRRA